MVYTSQYLEIEISTFQIKTVVYWKNQTINNFKASESNVIQISYNSDNNENCCFICFHTISTKLVTGDAAFYYIASLFFFHVGYFKLGPILAILVNSMYLEYWSIGIFFPPSLFSLQ